jgi:hypothetical protein
MKRNSIEVCFIDLCSTLASSGSRRFPWIFSQISADFSHGFSQKKKQINQILFFRAICSLFRGNLRETFFAIFGKCWFSDIKYNTIKGI